MSWVIDYYSEEVRLEIETLPADIRASYARLTNLLDQPVKFRTLGHLFTQRLGQPLHLLDKGFVVILHRFGTDIAPRGQDMTMFGNLSQRHTPTETGHIGILSSGLTITTPGMDGIGDAPNIGIGKFDLHPADPWCRACGHR